MAKDAIGEAGQVTSITMTVNGAHVSADVEDRTLLVHFLRERLGLTGTHVGCDTTQCGCCTIHVDGEAVKSCTIFAVQADGREILTIEGVAEDGQLHPLQAAFQTHHALQCGFCTPGMIMAGLDILRRRRAPDEDAIRHDLEGNFCRCTGYVDIVKAIKSVGG